MGKLVLHLPDGSTRDILLTRERMTIGRRADNDVCLPLSTVSGEHAAVVTILDDSFLEDLQSRNGTHVNGKTITKHFLRDRDEIDIGRQRLVYFSGDFIDVSEPRIAMQIEVPPLGGSVDARDALAGDAAGTRRARIDATPAPERERRRVVQDNATIDTSTLIDSSAALKPEARTTMPRPTLEVLDGPSAGMVATIDRDEFVVGRIGHQVAAIRRTDDGYRLVQLEGDAPPSLNGAALAGEGALLALGDEITIVETHLRYRPPA